MANLLNIVNKYLACLTLFAVTPLGIAQVAPTTTEKSSVVLTSSAERTSTRSLTLAAMGKPNGLQLSGVTRVSELNTGIRLDELVTKATLKLKVIYPQGMRHDQSFIRVYVNNQLAGMAQLKTEKAGSLHWMSVDLDPMLFTDFAPLRLEYDGTYDTTCLMPENPTLRFDIAADSKLEIESKPLSLVDDLALLPAPFFDPRDSSRLELPFVMPQQKSPTLLKAAGVVSSWLGAQASYRQAAFEIKQAVPDGRHSVVFSKGDFLPNGLTRDQITGPMLHISSLPDKPWIKQLYILGKNDEDLLNAAYALVLENQVLSGKTASVLKTDLGAPRKPYDAPRYTPINRPVRFAELMDYPTQLEANAGRNSVSLNLRLPPDLFSWAGKNIDLALKYQYTAPSDWNDSLLNVEINQSLIQSFRLAPREQQAQNRISLNLLGASDLNNDESLKIPAFRVGGNNELKFTFAFSSEGVRNCSGEALGSRAAIDPNSSLDFSDLPHYIKLPDLTAFANGGYPFSIYADLSQSVVVLPANPNPSEVQSYLNLMGLFGQWTGLPSSRVSVLLGYDKESVKGKHWMALGPHTRHAWLQESKMALPVRIGEVERSIGQHRVVSWMEDLWSDRETTEGGRAVLQNNGPIGAILGFESHLDKGMSGLLITGTDDNSFIKVSDSLLSYDKIGKIRGSVALLRGDQIESYRVGETFVAGSLPWWLKVRIAFSEYPALVALTGAGAGIALAILLYGWLARRAGRRIKGD
ncbi:MAG: cellulose biosynthesis cyclic di-GMP-binding regulatory protein BcsB [Limnobacter sp.]|nr:cellulose biosynthesis cyclic di-GMP-binding regulatory protein BcsB [Limnobacter sp.]